MLLSQLVALKAAYVLACEASRISTFPRRFRLTRREGFSRILQQRPRTNHWFAVHLQQNTVGCVRLGMTVSKRIMSSAVRRNSVKRLIRECFRCYVRQGKAIDVVIRLRKPLNRQDRATAHSVLCETLKLALTVE